MSGWSIEAGRASGVDGGIALLLVRPSQGKPAKASSGFFQRLAVSIYELRGWPRAGPCHELFQLSGDHPLSALLKLALGMDWLSKRISHIASWAVLIAALISAGNAFIRYGFDTSSNAWLEVQWYLFAVIVMLGAPYVLEKNEHVRVDLIYGKLKGNGPVYVDLFGLLFFLLPVIGLLAWLSGPYFYNVYVSKEMSSNAGGLIRWPVVLTMPLGFALLWLQGWAEVIKRVAYLTGVYAMDTHYEKPVQ
jgi:TRAP-type mannitol/chloroaromatic compound transport system permease small subunit